jgi:pyruvate,water dikinase
VRAAHAVAEADDALYFRAQRIVRRALLALGRRAFEQGALSDAESIVELPVDRAGAPDENSAVVAGALRRERRALWPPSEIRAGRATFRGLGAGGVLRGAGVGGRGYGRAYVLRDPLAAPATVPAGAVLVAPAILPSLGALLPGAAGLVTDHGGALSHGATLAREYGVPAVLGTGGATAALEDGEYLIVDGDSGRVYRVGDG